jgi:putative peptidoglycan lipid II flippase
MAELSMDNRNKQSFVASAGKVSLATGVSRILGLVREQVQAYFFGAGMATDAFVTAFRIPNLLRDLFAEGALSSAFVPIFKDKVIKQGKEEAYRLANYTLSDLILVVGIITALGIIFTPAIIYISAQGFADNPVKFDLTVNLTRIMFIFLLMVSISAVQMGILNSTGRFGIPALSPALFNVGMIIAPIFLYQYFSVPIYTMAIGVIIGGIGQIVFQLPSLSKIGFKFKFKVSFKDDGIKRINRLLSPMIIGLSASRINILINTLLATMMIEGSVSYLNYAFRLMHFPLGVFGVALGTVTLPKFSEQVSQGKFDRLAGTFHEAIGLSLFLVIPSAVFLGGFGHDLVRLIYERGAFDAQATTETARALLFYSFGLIGFAGVRVAAPVYYALGDARTPMYYSIISVILNIVFSFLAFAFSWGFSGLAAATSVAGLANFIQLIVTLRKKIVGIDYRHIFWHFLKITAGSFVALYITKLVRFDLIIGHAGIMGKIVLVSLQVFSMGVLYFVILWVLRVGEVYRFLAFIRRKG